MGVCGLAHPLLGGGGAFLVQMGNLPTPSNTDHRVKQGFQGAQRGSLRCLQPGGGQGGEAQGLARCLPRKGWGV